MSGILRFKQALERPFRKKLRVKSQILQTSNVFLPTELWLDILYYLNGASIAAISLTCRCLQDLAQPLIFQTDLAIHPFQSSIAYRGLRPESYIARCHERLTFISLPRIARHVQSFALIPYPTGHSLSRSAKPHVPENDIVERVFDMLPLFTNLRRLTLHYIRSTPQRVAVLRNMSLDQFELEIRGDDKSWVTIPDDGGLSTPIPAQRLLAFNCNASPHQIPEPVRVTLQFLNPRALEEIYSGPNGTDSVLVAMAVSPTPFAHLVVLDIYARLVPRSDFVPALQQCPVLNTLRLRSAFTDRPGKLNMAPIPSGTLQALRTYHGPPYLAPFFAHGRTIQDFKLWSSRRASSVERPANLATILLQLGSHVNVLEIGVTTVPSFLIRAIAENLPNLKSLSVNTHLSSYHPGIATSYFMQTQFTPPIVVGDLGGYLSLDILSLGVQIPDTIPPGSLEYEQFGLLLLEKFPVDYNPTSWDQWEIDLAWSKLIWKRLEAGDRRLEAPGGLSIEHVEYYKPVFRTLD